MGPLDPPGACKSTRLTGRSNFDRVYRTGKRIRLSDLTIIVAPNSLPHSRLGISVKKNFGNAVKRNRTKRVIRELFRRNRGLFPPGHDVVIAPQRDFLHQDWSRRQRNLVDALTRFRRIEN
jgi:ribonuclease P protein component